MTDLNIAFELSSKDLCFEQNNKLNELTQYEKKLLLCNKCRKLNPILDQICSSMNLQNYPCVKHKKLCTII